ncbi:SIS domain-containing protein [Vibrio fluvialis]|uniref:SIS domain-containing protein n=1 Tax=Vibrio fluvialis TaxID=676 RepID=UPI0005C8BD28|nr:SIS domain-containing protein [Vibrio fluvialis]
MNSYLGYSEQKLHSLNAYWTAKEISQQPDCWRQTVQIMEECGPAIKAFMSKVLAHKNLRIVLTGAGTSAFVGQSLAPALTQYLDRRVEAIATTDIVSNPRQYFSENLPTLLVSFARSGNSPESVAATELADQCLSQCYHLVFTCNSQGELYKNSVGNDNALALLMPEQTNDKSFAMTSSFSSMMLACLSVIGHENENSKEFERICKCSVESLKEFDIKILHDVNHEINRVVYLGSGGLKGLAQESALKMLELTSGGIVACYDSPLGFRHGPKSIVNEKTLVVVFISNDEYTRKYDLDLLSELRRDNIARDVIAVAAQRDPRIEDGRHVYIGNMAEAADVELLFPYLLFAQAYALHSSIALGNTPDNPCPTGEVNRVVQGVTIHHL